MPDLDSLAKREAHARALAERYGLAPHGVDAGELTLPRQGRGRSVRVTWLASLARLVRAGLITRARAHDLRERLADSEGGGHGLRWCDDAGTRWCLASNGGQRGDDYGAWLTAWYPPDLDEDPPGSATPAFVRLVERFVQDAAGARVRFVGLRGTELG